MDNNTYVEQALAIEALNMVGRFGTTGTSWQAATPGVPTTWYPPEAPTSTPCRQDGWMDGWYVDRKALSHCICVSSLTMVLSYVLNHPYVPLTFLYLLTYDTYPLTYPTYLCMIPTHLHSLPTYVWYLPTYIPYLLTYDTYSFTFPTYLCMIPTHLHTPPTYIWYIPHLYIVD